MHPYTKAIGVFEVEASRIKESFEDSFAGGYRAETSAEAFQEILQRDEAVGQCRWAIELLHAAYVKEKSASIQCVANKTEKGYMRTF